MIVEHDLVFTKTQTKMMDCWYACIQMVCSASAGSKTKPKGPAVKNHRSTFFVGQKLDFSSAAGTEILNENGLVKISRKIKLNSIDTLAQCLQTYGPIIVGGKFGPLNAGHFVVISGCNTGTGNVSICDPGWGKGKNTEPWSYISQKTWTIMGDENEPQDGAFIAVDPTGFFDQASRARR